MIDTGLPEVKNKEDFRHWCQAMEIDTKQAACLLGISVSNIYKYLDVSDPAPIRGMVLMTCELINQLADEKREQWVKAQLKLNNCTSPWPAKRPITA